MRGAGDLEASLATAGKSPEPWKHPEAQLLKSLGCIIGTWHPKPHEAVPKARAILP